MIEEENGKTEVVESQTPPAFSRIQIADIARAG